MSIFTGAGVAIVTPFTHDEEVDFTALGQLIDFQIENGTDAIIIGGCTGESATLTEEEKLACFRFTVDRVAHRVPVIAGTGTNNTRTAVSLARKAQECGVDALLIITPYYNKGTQNGLIAHYKAIAKAVTLPIILYNVPSRTGINMLPQTAVTLAKECENIVAIKEASGNISQIADLAALADGCLDIYSGNDDMNVPMMALGSIGAISVLSNVMPRETHDMIMEYLRGNTAEATRLQLQLLPMVRALFCEVNPIPVKAALKLMGMCTGVVRGPLTEIEPAHLEVVKRELERAGLL